MLMKNAPLYSSVAKNGENPVGPPKEKGMYCRQPRPAGAADAGLHAGGHGGLVGVPIPEVHHERSLQGQSVRRV